MKRSGTLIDGVSASAYQQIRQEDL